MAIDWVALQAALHAWVVGGSQLASEKVVWGGQDAPRPAGPAITLLVTNITETGMPWQGFREKYLSFDAKTVSAVDATLNTFSIAAHGLETGDGPVLVESDGDVPGGLPEDGRAWVIKVDDDTIRLAETFFDAMLGAPDAPTPNAIDVTSAGSGNITVSSIDDATQRAGEEFEVVSRGYLKLTLELRCHAAEATGANMAVAILQRVRSRRRLLSQESILQDANVSVIDIDRVRMVQGIRDAFLFEPRAYTDVHICVPFEDAEDLTIIERVLVTNLMTGVETTISVDDAPPT